MPGQSRKASDRDMAPRGRRSPRGNPAGGPGWGTRVCGGPDRRGTGMGQCSVDCAEDTVSERHKRLRNNLFTRGVPAISSHCPSCSSNASFWNMVPRSSARRADRPRARVARFHEHEAVEIRAQVPFVAGPGVEEAPRVVALRRVDRGEDAGSAGPVHQTRAWCGSQRSDGVRRLGGCDGGMPRGSGRARPSVVVPIAGRSRRVRRRRWGSL